MYRRPCDLVSQYNISHVTLRRWLKEGKLKGIKTPGGHNRYLFAEPEHEEDCRTKYVYCRVSSSKQKEDLQRQKASFEASHPNHQIITDIGSGLNYKRKGFLFLVDQVLSGRVEEIVVAYRDRLCRFSFELFQWLCAREGTTLVVQHQEEHSPEQELSEDLMSIVHVFSCKHHGMRRYRKGKDSASGTGDSSKTNSTTSQAAETLDEVCSADSQQSTASGQDRKAEAHEAPEEACGHSSRKRHRKDCEDEELSR
jgi:putative resolvase